MLPKVSVFLLVYQQVYFIRETLESVLAQDYPNLEIVVGDDGSSDGTQEILRKYEEKYSGLFKLILSPINAGITANSNKILAQCSGDYVALMGGDDLWLPGKLHKQIEWLLNNPDATLCHTKTDIFESTSGKTISLIPRSEASNNSPAGLSEFLKDTPGYVGSSFMLPRWAIPESGFDERVKWVSDWLFLLDILSKGRMGYIDEVLTRYRIHNENISSKPTIFFNDQMLAADIAEEKYPQFKGEIENLRIELIKHYLSAKGLTNSFNKSLKANTHRSVISIVRKLFAIFS